MPVRKLGNGVMLGKTLQHSTSGFEFDKAADDSVFNGAVKEVTVHCFKLTCGSYPHKTAYRVGRAHKSISVGCVRFSAAQVQAIKKWLKVKQRRVAAKR